MKKESGPQHVRALFERYKRVLKAPEKTVLETASEVINDVVGVHITPQQMSYIPTTQTLHIKHSLLRSSVLPHKELILNHLKGRLGERSAPRTIL